MFFLLQDPPPPPHFAPQCIKNIRNCGGLEIHALPLMQGKVLTQLKSFPPRPIMEKESCAEWAGGLFEKLCISIGMNNLNCKQKKRTSRVIPF
ncbi:hypothetical protein CEXT_565071 [Caerostris extrusa]|uniref:Uncharacterized protein n=1 Tax=Caerostris extrusa TaxID=172846 RepID=A0AAV4T018_CAEEX|nr:hypothetical protein CEXT_565071 [Caerostris extrusa]